MSRVSFNSNISALTVQRRLGSSTSDVSRSFERLATGLRINRASDDAAGLAIADTLRVNNRLYNQATRNVNDALSMLNIMEGSLSNQSNITQRLIELAEQSANGTLSDTQREAIQSEYRSLVDEFGRIGDTTTFNDLELLRGIRDGNPSEILIQAGIDGSALSELAIQAKDTGTLSGTLDINSLTLASLLTDSFTDEEVYAQHGEQSIAKTTVVDESGVEREVILVVTSATPIAVEPGSPDIYQLNIGVYQRVSDTGGVGAQANVSGFSDVLDENDDWVLAATSSILRADEDTGGPLEDHPLFPTASSIDLTLQFEDLSIDASYTLDISGLTIADSANTLGEAVVAETTSLEFSGVETQSRARLALEIAKRRLDELSEIRGEVGAVQSRLNSVLAVNQTAAENVASAESRIRDVDVASEAANLLKSQITQQAAASILGQANQQPAVLLSLLS